MIPQLTIFHFIAPLPCTVLSSSNDLPAACCWLISSC